MLEDKFGIEVDVGLFIIIAFVGIPIVMCTAYGIYGYISSRKTHTVSLKYEELFSTIMLSLLTLSFMCYIGIRDIGESALETNTNADNVVYQIEESHELFPLRQTDGDLVYVNCVGGDYVYCYKDSGYRYPQVDDKHIEFVYISENDVPTVKFVEYRYKNKVFDLLFNIHIHKQVLYVTEDEVKVAGVHKDVLQ